MTDVTLDKLVEIVVGALNPRAKEEQSRCNKWLSTFQRTKEAWPLCLELLYHDKNDVAFFGANMLLSKVRSEWTTLAADERHAMFTMMSNLLEHFLSGTSTAAPMVLDRFAICMAAAALLEGGASLDTFLSAALSVAASATSESSMRIALKLLEAYGTEGLMRPNKHKDAAIAAAAKNIDAILRLLELCAFGQTYDEAHLGTSPLTAEIYSAISFTPLIEDVLKATNAYSFAGIRLDILQRQRPVLLAGILVALGASDESSSMQEHASSLLIDLIGEMGRNLEETCKAASFATAETATTFSAAADLIATVALPPETAAKIRAHRSGDMDDMLGIGAGDSQSSKNIQLLDAEAVSAAIIGLHSILTGIACMQDKFKHALIESDHNFVYTMCKICTSLVAAAPRLLISSGTAAGALLDILLEGAQHASIKIMDAADEAWPYIQAIRADERPAGFGRELFTKLFERLVRGCTYPEEFPPSGDWDEYNPPDDDPDFFAVDEHMFHTFRENILATALQGVYSELKGGFVVYLSDLLHHAADAGWQSVEAILYVARSVHLAIKSSLKPSGVREQLNREDSDAVVAFLQNVCKALASEDPLFTACPLVVAAAARFIQVYGAFVVANPDLAAGVVGFLLKAIQLPASSQVAAASLRAILNRLPQVFATQAFVDTATAAFSAALASGALKHQDAETVTAAIIKPINHLPDPSARVALMKALVDICLQSVHGLFEPSNMMRLKELEAVAGDYLSGSKPVPRESLEEQMTGRALSTEAAAARKAIEAINTSLEPPSQSLFVISALLTAVSPCDVFDVLLHVWPTMTSVLENFRYCETLLGGLCAIVAAALSAAGPEAVSHLPVMMEFILGIQASVPTPACFDAIVNAVEAFSHSPAMSDETVMQVFSPALHTATQPVFSMLSSGHDALADKPQLFTSLFGLGMAYLLHLPIILVESEHLLTYLQAASVVFSFATRETDLSRSALAFVARVYYLASPVINPGNDAAASMLSSMNIPLDKYTELQSCLAKTAGDIAPQLDAELIQVIADGPNPDVLDALADCVLCITAAYPDQARSALEEAMEALPQTLDSLPPEVAASLDESMRAAIIGKLFDVAAISLGSPGSEATRPFQEFIADFSAICRGHAAITALDRAYAPMPGIMSARAMARG